MKKALSLVVTFLISLMVSTTISFADNPVVQTIYTADPAPLVVGDTVYLYTGHDEDGSTYFTMNEWRVYSSTDMVNWTDHGSPLSYKTFSWAKGDAWAGHAIERNGKFYYYATVTSSALGRPVIGVAVSDSPTGPFVDALGYPLVASAWGDIDPVAYIDEDGQAYLYWGNPELKYVKLNPDMISYDKNVGIVTVPLTTEGFGKRTGNASKLTLYEEGPWFYKHGDLYYMVYAAGGIPEYISYSTSNSPTGPWTYRGVIMSTQGKSFTNHPGVIDFKGHSYFFYHNGALPGGGGFTRSVAVEEFNYNPDGTFPVINMTTQGPAALMRLNPYVRNEAETIAWASGIKTEPSNQGGMNVYHIDNGDYIKIKNVDFGSTGAGLFSANVSSASNGGTLELHLDSTEGTLIGTLPISNTGGDQVWQKKTTNISGASEVHDVYLVFKGEATGNLFKIDYWQFKQMSAAHDLSAINASIDKYKIDTVSGANQARMKVTAVYTDGTSADVTAQAVATAAKDGIVSINKGVVTGVGYGSTSIDVSYGGMTDTLNLLVKDLNSELTVKELTVDNPSFALDSGQTAAFKITAEYLDGHKEDVTRKAVYNNPSPNIAEVSNGTITAKASGTTQVAVSYQGELGEAATTQISVSVDTPVVIAIEAETAVDNSKEAYVHGTINGHTWSLVDGQSTKAMFFGPDTGFSMPGTDTATLASGSRLGYKINIPKAGAYQLWILAKSVDFNSDSVHVGLDQQYKFTSNGIEGISGGQFKWVNLSNGGSVVPGGEPLNMSAGEHELNFWGREDGLTIDRIYLTTSTSTADPVWPSTEEPEPLEPAVALSATDSVKPGGSFTVGVKLNNLVESVYAQDITFTYDANVFEYMSVTSATYNVELMTEDKDTLGEVRLIAANIGGISGASTPSLDLTFKVKSGVQNTSGTIAVTRAELGTSEGAVIQAKLDHKVISVESIDVSVDKTALNAAITNGQNLYDAAVVGTLPGQYPQAAKDAFGIAINAAKAVKDNSGATQSQVDNAVTDLLRAVNTFKSAVIKEVSADLNNDGIVNVGDLAIVAYHYGKDSTSSDWAKAKIADLNGDQKIDITDLAYVASKIAD
ncbi:family 43 glycosylhydrolase [Paenibacillus sp. FSL F4-0125]|uniref:family 43 glycosylhydrolase n=1 Tax=Paenibacillus sp. FSL F4-0125 TaxID=2954730 RepID=UPI0030F89268